MGLFGGSSSSSFSETIQQDQRVIAEEAEVLAGAGAVVSMPGSIVVGTKAVAALPGSVLVGTKAKVGDIVIQEYTPEVQRTIAQVVETFAETSQEVTEVLGEKLLTTQQGVASILPEMAKYVAIAVVVIIVARKVWK